MTRPGLQQHGGLPAGKTSSIIVVSQWPQQPAGDLPLYLCSGMSCRPSLPPPEPEQVSRARDIDAAATSLYMTAPPCVIVRGNGRMEHLRAFGHNDSEPENPWRSLIPFGRSKG